VEGASPRTRTVGRG